MPALPIPEQSAPVGILPHNATTVFMRVTSAPFKDDVYIPDKVSGFMRKCNSDLSSADDTVSFS
jgi:hypothetical protein